MLSTFNKKQVAKSRSRVAAQASWSPSQAKRATSPCIYTLRSYTPPYSLLSLRNCSGPRPEGVERAKQLCNELLEKVKSDYQAFKDRPPPNRYGDRDSYSNGRQGYGDRGDRGDRDRSQSYGYGGAGGGYGGHNSHAAQDSPTAAAPADANAQATDYNTHLQWATYYQANPEQDPYAAYGGYAAVMAQYSQGYGQYYGQAYGASQSPAPGGAAAAPPPPPPSEPAPPGYGAAPPPPPPPPAASPHGGYSAVRILYS